MNNSQKNSYLIRLEKRYNYFAKMINFLVTNGKDVKGSFYEDQIKKMQEGLEKTSYKIDAYNIYLERKGSKTKSDTFVNDMINKKK